MLLCTTCLTVSPRFLHACSGYEWVYRWNNTSSGSTMVTILAFFSNYIYFNQYWAEFIPQYLYIKCEDKILWELVVYHFVEREKESPRPIFDKHAIKITNPTQGSLLLGLLFFESAEEMIRGFLNELHQTIEAASNWQLKMREAL